MTRALGNVEALRINLAQNESAIPCGEATLEAIAQACSRPHLYPSESDIGALARKLAALHAVEPGCVGIGPGLTELLTLLTRTIVGARDEVLVAERSFVLYEMASHLVGAVLHRLPLQDRRCDLEAMARAIGPRTRLVFIANPDNPTGSAVTREALEAFLQRVPRRVTVVIDEAYAEYSPETELQGLQDLLERHPNLVVGRTLSKAWGLAGLRLGYLLMGAQARTHLTPALLPFRVSRVALAGAMATIEDTGRLQRVVALNTQVRELYYSMCERIGLGYWPSCANFVTMQSGPETSALLAALSARGISVLRLSDYGMDDAIRVSTGTHVQALAFIACVEGFYGQLGDLREHDLRTTS